MSGSIKMQFTNKNDCKVYLSHFLNNISIRANVITAAISMNSELNSRMLPKYLKTAFILIINSEKKTKKSTFRFSYQIFYIKCFSIHVKRTILLNRPFNFRLIPIQLHAIPIGVVKIYCLRNTMIACTG